VWWGRVVSRIISGENTTGNITQVSVLPTFILFFFFGGRNRPIFYYFFKKKTIPIFFGEPVANGHFVS
jgi:hypothetical protein